MTAAASRLLATLSEKEFQAQVIQRAQELGWRVAHFRTAQTGKGAWVTPVAADGAGFPDLVCVRERTVYFELKSAKGPVKKAQKLWLATLLDAGDEAYLARPTDYDSVIAILAGRPRVKLTPQLFARPDPGLMKTMSALRAATRKETQQ